MSSVVVVTPLIIASWPVITAAVTAAVGSMGFAVASAAASQVDISRPAKARTRTEIDVEDSEVLAEAAIGEELVVVKGDLRVVFSRDERGALKLCVEGESHSKAELRRIGEELLGRVTQQYVYHRIVNELRERNMTIVDEQVGADQSVKIRVRNV